MINSRLYRAGRFGCSVFALSITSQTVFGGAAGQAYFSFEGDLSNPGDQVDFNLSLTRSVSSADDLRFVTYASSGGTNAAGDTISGGGIDSVLELFDIVNFSRGFNDDHLTLDSLISWFPTQTSGTPLNPDPLASGDYRLNLAEFGNNAAGRFAVDLIGPTDAIAFSGASTSGTTQINDFKFGSIGGGSAFYQHGAGSGNMVIWDSMSIAHTGDAFFNFFSNTITVLGQTTLNAGGTLNLAGGNLQAEGGMLVDGGTFSYTSGTFGLLFNNTFEARNNAQVSFTGNRTVLDNNTFDINSGADLTLTGFLDVGLASQGDLILDGSGTTLTVGDTSFWGLSGGSALVTIRNQAVANMNGNTLRIGAGSTASTSSSVGVESGGKLNVGGLTIGDQGPVSGINGLTVTGNNSRVDQRAGSELTIGHAANGTANLTVENAGVFNASNSGTLNVNATGTLEVNNATFNAKGNGVADPGGILNTSGTLIVSDGGLIDLNGGQPAGVFDPGAAGTGGGVNMTGGAVNLSGTGRIRANGGRAGDDGQTGPAGGTFAVSSGTVTAAGDSTIELIGGKGGADPGIGLSAQPGGVGGVMTVSGGSLNLQDAATLSLRGGEGGRLSAIGDRGGDGGTGGTLLVNGGSVSVNNNAAVNLRGGNATFNAFEPGGDGGDGGQLLVSAGSMTVNGGLVTLSAGTLGAGSTPGAPGTNGLIDITGGTFTLNGGEVYTGTFQRSGAGAFNHNDGKLTVAGGSFNPGSSGYTINGPSAVELPTLVLTDGAVGSVSNNLLVGTTQRARLEVTNNATAETISGFFVVGQFGGSEGSLVVNSGGTARAGGRFVIGDGGTGVANISSGGTLIATSDLDLAAFGQSSVGTLNVDGVGALVLVFGNLYVGGWIGGDGGTGTLNIDNNAVVTGNNTLHIYDGGTVNLTSGRLAIDTVDHTSGGEFEFTGGILNVESFTGSLDNDGGTLAPIASPGVINVTGNYHQNAGLLAIELAGGGGGGGIDFDQLVVGNDLTLAGTLDVSLFGGYVPTIGDNFAIIVNSGSRSGTFDTVQLPSTPPGVGLRIEYIPNIVRLVAGLAGDLNGDGFVGIDDLNIVLSNWNQNVTAGVWSGGDPSGDGFIGIDDLNTVLGNWNAGTPPPPGSKNIPEPSAALIGLSMVTFGVGRRRV